MITLEKLLESVGYTGQLLLEVSIDELRRQFVDSEPQKLTPEVFDQIVQASNNKSNFATWLCKKVFDKVIPENEIAGWTEVFEFFERYKSRFEKKDINQIKTAEDITAFKQDYEKVKADVEEKKTSGGKAEELEPCQLGSIRTSDGQNWKVYKVGKGQFDLERQIGAGTSWCTVANLSYFNKYLREGGGHYYIFINKSNPKEKYQFHHETNQFMDKNDITVKFKLPFIQEFFEYLNMKEGKPIPERVLRAKEEMGKDLEFIQQLASKTLPEGAVISEDLEEGQIALLNQPFGKQNFENSAIFLNTALQGKMTPVILDRIKDFYFTNYRVAAIIPKQSGKVDIVVGEAEYPLRDFNDSSLLPQATEKTINLYIRASSMIGSYVNSSVRDRCNEDLPGIDQYRTKKLAGISYYEIPTNIPLGRINAELNLIRNNQFVISPSQYSGTAYVAVDFHDNHVYSVNKNLSFSYGFEYDSVPGKLNKYLQILKDGFGVDITSKGPEGIPYELRRAYRWAVIGGKDGVKEELKKTVKIEGIDPEKVAVVQSEKLSNLIEYNSDNYTILYNPSNVNDLIYINRNVGIGKCREMCLGVESVIDSAEGFRELPIEPLELSKVFLYLHIDVPNALEKIIARSKDITTPTVLRVLLKNANNFREYDVPLYRMWNGSPYRYTFNGLYGTWDSLKDIMKDSSTVGAEMVQKALNEDSSRKADVFLFFNREISRRAWNCLIRILDENNKIVGYIRRLGNKDPKWDYTGVLEHRQIEGTTNYESTIVVPQPREARRRRGERNAQQQQQQANAPAINLGAVAENLNRFAEQSQYADVLYNIPGNKEDILEVLGGLGAPVLETLPNNTTGVVLYQLRARRGEGGPTLGLLIKVRGTTVISGQPSDYTYATCEAHNRTWRGIIYELTNSVPRFQQACDICEEKNIPLPEGLQTWPNRRNA